MSPSVRRLRLDGIDHEVGPDGRCSMTVRLGLGGDEEVAATVEGLETHQGRLRAAARATLQAAAQAVSGSPDFHLVGIKGMRAFDGWVVIIRVNGRDADETSHRLLGAASAEEEEELLTATVQATLDATNRLLEPLIEG